MASERILVVDDQCEVLEYLADLLSQSGYKVLACGDAVGALEIVAREGSSLGLAIVDLDLGSGSDDGLRLLGEIKARQRDLPVMILTAQGGTRMAVQAMKLGAVDFLEKDTYLVTNLTARMKKASEFLEIIRENRRLREETENLRQEAEYYKELVGQRRRLVGKSAALQMCLAEAQTVASAPRPVLIRGERGTGKELVAAYIHGKSSRANGPFIVVNCAAFSGNLLESEMFGHERGAFTGSVGRKPGRFELADGGTLFLDEIGNMSPDFQEMILRVVEYQRFERVQGTETLEVDVKILAATNTNIEEMMEKGCFRRDLYDRLAFKEIWVPPLRERKEDIPVLVEYFLAKLREEVPSVGEKRLSPAAMEKLTEFSWPGNVRQLKHSVECMAIECAATEIAADYVRLPHAVLPDEGGTFEQRVDNLRKGLIEEAYARANGNQRAAARAIGLTYDQFRHHYRKLGTRTQRLRG